MSRRPAVAPLLDAAALPLPIAPALPESAKSQPRMATTPLAVFDELWAAFSYHCAFLHLRSATRDWHSDEFRSGWRSRAAALPQTEAAATGPELLALLGEVVELFSEDSAAGIKPDIHCFLLLDEENRGDEEAARNDPPEFVAFHKGPRARWMEHAAALAHADAVRQDGQFKFGMAAKDVGYIQLNSMGGFTHAAAPSGGYAGEYAQLAAVEACMQEAILHFKSQGARGVIIDVRFNSGGDDHIGMVVASHFFAQSALGFSKRSRLPMAPYAGPAAELQWTDYSIGSSCGGGGGGLHPEPTTLDCAVAVLSSGYTLSAAEVLTLMMQAHPACTFVGASTCGCYSDILECRLANGWTVGLSNQV